jgi:hypothetical protein
MPIFERYVKNFKNRSDVSKFVQLPNGVWINLKQANVLTWFWQGSAN